MSPFSAPFSGAPKSEGFCFQSERLLYRREPNGVRADPGKQKPQSCRTQELARSSAQENERQRKAAYELRRNRFEEHGHAGTYDGKQIKKSDIAKASLRMTSIALMTLPAESWTSPRGTKSADSQYSLALNAECDCGRAAGTGGKQRILGSGGSIGTGDEDLASVGKDETVKARGAVGLAGRL